MTRPREETTRAAAAAIRRAIADPSILGSRPALVGFDGFVDSIIHVVDTRHAMEESAYTRLATIEQFAARVGSAAGKSTNIELVVKEDRFGGNGPLMAGALGRLGAVTTYIGAVGREENPSQIHPLYQELERRCRVVIPVAPPAHTDALEFDDGKVMLGKPRNIQSVTWESLKRTLGPQKLAAMVGESSLLAVVNWVMMGGVESIWEGLAREVLPALPKGKRPRLFFDLCDPAKRSNEDLLRALRLIGRLQQETAVTLGLNLAEAERVAGVLGLKCFDAPGLSTRSGVLCHAASVIRSTLGLDTVVVHPREGAAASDGAGSAWFEGPFTLTPKLSTGAGDHFNGGFALGQILGLPLDECLAVGCGVSGAYVRDAVSPSAERLAGFLEQMPSPEK